MGFSQLLCYKKDYFDEQSLQGLYKETLRNEDGPPEIGAIFHTMYLHAEIMHLRKAWSFAANVITYNCKFPILYLSSDFAENNEKIYLLSFKDDYSDT